MNKYKLKMKTPTGLGNEYVYVYATSNFERYLNTHRLGYARDITKDYQLTDRFEQLQQENQSLKDRIEKAIEHIGQELLVYDNESDEYDVGIKLLEILKGGKQ